VLGKLKPQAAIAQARALRLCSVGPPLAALPPNALDGPQRPQLPRGNNCTHSLKKVAPRPSDGVCGEAVALGSPHLNLTAQIGENQLC